VRVYYRPGSGRPVRVAWLLEEIGAPYEPVSVSAEEVKAPEHLARQPLGRVPVLETDGEVLFESTAICLHLADKHPEAGLIAGLGSPDRARVYQWASFAMTEVEPAIVEFGRHSQSDPERAAAGADRFRAGAAVIERALEGHEFLVEDRLTAADIVAGGVLGLAARRGLLPAAELPQVSAYVERLVARPAFARAAAATESSLAALTQRSAAAGQ
jgi:glutathione S-transferase